MIAPTIQELAEVWKEMNEAGAQIEVAEKALEETDEFKTVSMAQKAMENTPQFSAVNEATKRAREISGRYKSMVEAYKNEKIRIYGETGEKNYDGGNIRVNKTLFVSEQESFVQELAENKMYKLLQPNMDSFSKLSEDALDLLNISRDRVRWMEKPSASIAGDLSEYLSNDIGRNQE